MLNELYVEDQTMSWEAAITLGGWLRSLSSHLDEFGNFETIHLKKSLVRKQPIKAQRDRSE
jgi:hypothetical protein